MVSFGGLGKDGMVLAEWQNSRQVPLMPTVRSYKCLGPSTVHTMTKDEN